jgi:hypothetical protein
LTTSEIQSQITQTALQYGVPPSLALAVAKQESGFNPNRVSPVNNDGTRDYGVMQLNSNNLAAWGVTNPLDPTQNINAGVSYLAQLLQQYNGDQASALAAYNAGPSKVASGRIPPATQSYVAAVMANQGQFQGTVPPDYTTTPAGLDTLNQTGAVDYSQVSVAGFALSTPVAVGAGLLGLFLLWKMFGD